MREQQIAKLIGFTVVFYIVVLLIAPAAFLDKPCGDCNSVPDNFLAGYGWVDDSGNFADARPPGHALIIIGLKSIASYIGAKEILIFRIFNVLTLTASAVILFLIARNVWGTDAVLIGPLGWVTSPLSFWFLTNSYSEVPFFFFFFASILAFVLGIPKQGKQQLTNALLVGALLGVAMMIRTIAVGLPLVLFVIWVVIVPRQHVLRYLGVFLSLILGVAAMVGPWSYVTYQQTGSLSVLGPPTLSINSLHNGVSFVTDLDGDREELRVPPRLRGFAEDIHHEFSLVERYEKDTGGLRPYLSILWSAAVEKPAIAAEFVGLKMMRAWYGTYTHKHEMFIIFLQLGYFLLIFLSFLSMIRDRISAKSIVLLSLGSVMYFWGLAVIFEPLVRYMVAPIGLLFLLLPALTRHKFTPK